MLPVSILNQVFYKTRRFFYNYNVLKKYYFRVPVISVGNVSFGGTGKTPLIIWLIKEIEKINKSALVLTRGYKSEYEKKSKLIVPEELNSYDSKKIGDEPSIILREMNKGAVLIGKNRSQNLIKNFDNILSDVVLLDDGFQHLKIHRSLNLVLFDSTMPVSMYKPAPLGYLREGLSSLKFADVIIFSRVDQASDFQLKSITDHLRPYLKKNVIIAKFKYTPSGLYNLKDERVNETSFLKNKDVISLTALASSSSFDKSLESFGAKIIKRFEFQDHHYFTKNEIEEALKFASDNDAFVLTTEKDKVKLKGITQDKRILSVKVDVDFVSGQTALTEKVQELIKLDSL